MKNPSNPLRVAIAWCLAWGKERAPKFDISHLQQMRQALNEDGTVPENLQWAIEAAKQLDELPFPKTLNELKQIATQNSGLWNSQIGLVYGGATKIKQYVFEASKLPDIRGASGLLDRINLVDLLALFGKDPEQCTDNPTSSKCQAARKYGETVRNWLKDHFPQLQEALIPELIIYSTGGNILAFCPAAFVDDLADAIERRYTQETLTANSCAVGKSFKALEIRFGLLKDNIDDTLWFDWYQKNHQNPLVEAYYGKPENQDEILLPLFQNRKSFNELAGLLAALFNQRRSGNDLGSDRPLRCYPPMFETHPYLRRDGGDRRSAIFQANELPGSPWFSEPLIRKRLVSELAKNNQGSNEWYRLSGLEWQPGAVDSWVSKFKDFLEKYQDSYQYRGNRPRKVEEAKSVREISNASNPPGFVAYIYADGNNMGGYIQKIKTPQEYREFSRDIFKATEESVYEALAQHLKPHQLMNLQDPDNEDRNGAWIHPFEIITIGGDDVFLIVPADRALAIAQTIAEEFEKKILAMDREGNKGYSTSKTYNPEQVHRYHLNLPEGSHQSQLSMSIGVLMTAEETPIYYAEKLTNQLLKSAKKYAKQLKEGEKNTKKGEKKMQENSYYGGTIDFLVMKGITMISSNISEFRQQGLTKKGKPTLKLYGSPYTLHEVKGLLKTAQDLKKSDFPRSQLYQIRSLLERGKHTAILNYRYFRTRLPKDKQDLLIIAFEDAWCQPKDSTNKGNLAPWMSLKKPEESDPPPTTTYETIWREIVDLYPFISVEEEKANATQNVQEVNQ